MLQKKEQVYIKVSSATAAATTTTCRRETVSTYTEHEGNHYKPYYEVMATMTLGCHAGKQLVYYYDAKLFLHSMIISRIPLKPVQHSVLNMQEY